MDPIYSNYSPIFLYVNQYSFSEKWVYQESHVPYSLVRYICSGSATFEVNGVAHEVHKDSVFYIPQGCTERTYSVKSPLLFLIRTAMKWSALAKRPASPSWQAM